VVVWTGLLVLGLSNEPSLVPAAAATPVATATAVCTAAGGGPTPVSAQPVETPGIPVAAGGDVTAQITAAVANLVTCLGDAAWQTGVALVTDRYLQTNFGTMDRNTVVANLDALTAAGLTGAASLDGVADIRSQGVGFASAEVTWRQGNALRFDRWRFVAVQGIWLLDEVEYLESEATGDAVGVEAIVEVDRLRLSRDRLVDPGLVVIHVRNLSPETTSLAVFRSGIAELRDRIAGLVPPSSEPRFAGEVILPAGEAADLVLRDLAPDTYTVVAGFRGPGGTPQVRDAFSVSLAVSDP
jgi:hypothetical protein